MPSRRGGNSLAARQAGMEFACTVDTTGGESFFTRRLDIVNSFALLQEDAR